MQTVTTLSTDHAHALRKERDAGGALARAWNRHYRRLRERGGQGFIRAESIPMPSPATLASAGKYPGHLSRLARALMSARSAAIAAREALEEARENMGTMIFNRRRGTCRIEYPNKEG